MGLVAALMISLGAERWKPICHWLVGPRWSLRKGHFPDDLDWSIPTDWGGEAQTQQVEGGYHGYNFRQPTIRDLKFDKSFFGWNKIDWISIFSFCLAGRTFHFCPQFFLRSSPGIPSATRWLHVAPSAQAAERLSQMEMQRAAAAPSELVEWFPNTTTRNSKGGILLWGWWTIITAKICQFLTLSCYSLLNENHEHGNFGDWSQSFHDLQSVLAETLTGWKYDEYWTLHSFPFGHRWQWTKLVVLKNQVLHIL